MRTWPYREADLVLKVMTPRHGRLSLLARSGRRSQRRFGSPLDLFDHGEFEIKAGRGSLNLVHTFTPISSFRALREDLDRMVAASTLCEAADLLSHDEVTEGAPESFEVLRTGLTAIAESSDRREALRALYLGVASLLAIAGYLDPALRKMPTARHLNELLDHLERCTDRQVQSRAALAASVAAIRAAGED